VAWFEKAAEGGNISAHLALTSIYYKGDGVEKDLAKAAKHARIAAEGGVVNAQMRYALMLLNGEGLTRDPAAAYFWLYIAMQKGEYEAVVLIRRIGKDEVDTAERMAIENRANLWQPAPPKAR
jgi:TPR repeat protein